MSEYRKCPCGATPTELWIDGSGNSKYFTASCIVCGEWMVEFKSRYEELDSELCISYAKEAWNALPRDGMEGAIS